MADANRTKNEPGGDQELTGNAEDLLEETPDLEGKGARLPMIVGIGASAGGLEALRDILPELPAHRGLTYVVVQHMDPKHKSMLDELLTKHSPMPISEIGEETEIEPDKIFICPPGRDVRIRDGRFFLSTPSNAVGPKPSIDLFFNSLAENHPERGVGVILSGTGSDGAHGIRAIKNSGGITIVQEPTTAKYDGMPRSAIATGQVDLILPPAKIGPELDSILSSPQLALDNRVRTEAPSQDFTDDLLTLMLKRTGSDFSQYKMATLQRRIALRVALHKLDTLQDYLSLLHKSPEEVDALRKDILIAVTSFFRDREAFDSLTQFLPNILSQKNTGDSIRVWAPGCATGEEAYSVAILLSESLEHNLESFQVQIFGTDIDGEAMTTARRAVYPEASLANLDQELVQRYFRRQENTFQVVKSLRDKIVFARQDIINDPPFSHMDLISCRNLLIYFTPELQERIIPLFHYALNPGGLLFLGKSESVGKHGDLFTSLSKKWRIFKRRDQANFNPLTLLRPRGKAIASKDRPSRNGRAPSPSEILNQGLADAYGQKAVLLDDQLNVVFARGDLHGYLGITSGEAGLNILQLARDELRMNLRAIIHKSRRENQAIKSPAVPLEVNGANRRVQVSSHPITVRETNVPYYLVIFEERDLSERVDDAQEPYDADSNSRINELEQELMATREHLQTTSEELETSNEELQSLNEELQSANEELQSANEELETSNEELQATNEELTTVNEELQIRGSELTQANSDLENALQRVGVAMVMVDRELKVTRFTPPAAEIFDLGTGSNGLMITGLPRSLDIPDFKSNLFKVLNEGASFNQDLPGGGRLYELNLFPYHNETKRVAGAVLTLLDKTELHRREQAYKSLADNSPDIIARFDRLMRYVYVNPSAEKYTGLPVEDFIGKTNRQLDMPPELCQQWEHGINQVFETGETVEVNFELPAPGGPEYFQSRMVPETAPGGGVRHVLAISRDQSKEQRAHRWEKRLAAKRRQLLEVTHQVLAETTQQGLLQKVVDAARALTDAKLGAGGHGNQNGKFLVAAASKGVGTAPCSPGEIGKVHLDGVHRNLIDKKKTLRLTQEEMSALPDWWVLPEGHAPLRGVLGARLEDATGATSGLIMVSDKNSGEFDQDDEALLAQLAAQASLALQHVEARQQAEQGAKTLQALMDHVPMGIAIADNDCKMLAISGYGMAMGGHAIGATPQSGECMADLADGLFKKADNKETDPEDLPLVRAIRRGEVIQDEEWMVTGGGGELLPVACTAGPIRDRDGGIMGGVVAWTDISNQKTAMGKITRAKARAEDANQAKSRFLANMSHEIRTPLNSLIGISHLLLGDDLNEKVREKLKIVNSQAEHLLSLVNDILDISKIEEGALPLDQVDFDLRQVLYDICQQMAVQAQMKGLDFCCDHPLSYTRDLVGDPLRLSQVLLNLLSNAIKFTDQGEVVLRMLPQEVSEGAATFRFEVGDTGPGIDQDQRDKLFGRFSQLDQSNLRQNGGVGLGLAISKELVGMMGGEIGLASTPGQGSTFFFTATFPIHQRPDRQERGHQVLYGKRILVADASACGQGIIKTQLEGLQCEVEMVSSGQEALRLMEEAEQGGASFDAFLINWQLPDQNAPQLVETIRRTGISPETKLVLMSPLVLYREPQVLEKAGFSGLLRKPVIFERLCRLLLALYGVLPAEQRWRDLESEQQQEMAQRERGGLDILVVDDNEPNRMVALAILRQLGFQAEGAGSGPEALEDLMQTKYDLVLMDLRMPGMDGFQTLAAIRDENNDLLNHNVPVVALTANAAKEEQQACLEAGMSGYISKPVRPKALGDALDRILQPRKKRLPRPLENLEPPPTDSSPIWDHDDLLQRLAGDHDLFAKVAESFRGDIPAQMADLRQAQKDNRTDRMMEKAHTLKGSAANISAPAMRRAAEELERALMAGSEEDYARLIMALEEQVAALLATLDNK